MRKTIVLLAVAVLFLIAFLSAGCFFALEDSSSSESGSELLRLQCKDALADASGDSFAETDDLVRIEQTGGDPFDWNDYDVKSGSNTLKLYSVDGDTSKTTSQTGVTSMFRPSADGQFTPGDFIVISIYEGENKVYESMEVKLT